jgi:hypothetical protein
VRERSGDKRVNQRVLIMFGMIMAKITRREPRRRLSKKEAIRHLIHATVRMVAIGEDPFSIQVLVQSADKLLIDVAKRTGRKLVFEWDEVIRPEYKKAFFELHRETFNFFKHADKDHDAELHVGDITQLNVLMLAVCASNYHAIFGEWTEHMRLMFNFARVIFPEGFVPADWHLQFDQIAYNVKNMTPREYFAGVWDDPFSRAVLPGLADEKAEDLVDTTTFYATRLSDLLE